MWRYVLCLMPMVATAQVEQGAPNADFEPAFEAQTRAPEMAQTDIRVDVFARGFDFPWGIAALPDGRFLVTERGGTLKLVDETGSLIVEVSGVPAVEARNQGGLLDVAVSPNFVRDGIVYLTYAKAVSGGVALAAARGVLRGDALTEVGDIFVQDMPRRGGRHFGSRIIPVEAGVLITSGDRGSPGLAQGSNFVGKVIWVDSDGPHVWSTGHRNIQGAILRDGELWTVEHGPRGGDELNRPQQGLNYGWPVVSYGINYNGSDVGNGIAVADGFEQPVYYWDPVIAPGGMAHYPSNGPYASWQGDLFVASLFPGGVRRLKIDDSRVIGEEHLLPDIGRIRDIEVLANGDLLILPDVEGADILRVTPRP